jgi:hypothetical protein
MGVVSPSHSLREEEYLAKITELEYIIKQKDSMIEGFKEEIYYLRNRLDNFEIGF